MNREFEISTYGVKKELLEVTGRMISVGKVIDGVLGFVNIFLAVRALYNETTHRIIQDRKLRGSIKIQVYHADSIRVNGIALYGLDDVTIVM